MSGSAGVIAVKLPSLLGSAGVFALAVGLSMHSPSLHAQPAAGKNLELLEAFRLTFDQGKYDLAAEYLKAFAATNPSDAQLREIEEKFGPGAFQKLLTLRKWSDDPKADAAARETVKTLSDRTRAALDKVLRDPARISKFVRNLGASYEERIYALNELRRAGDVVVPYLVKAYIGTPTPALAAGILDAVTKLDSATVAGWLAALDGMTPEQRFNVFRAILARPDVLNLPSFAETDFTPYLWYLAALPADEAPQLRQLALSILQQFVRGNVAKQDPVERLTAIARSFYEHQAAFRTTAGAATTGVILWRWDDQAKELLRLPNTPVADAEEYYGLRYARWALERKPDYEPAQQLLLSLATDRAAARSGGADLARTAPEVYRLLAQTPTPMLAQLLSEAMARKQNRLVLALTKVAADRADKTLAAEPLMGQVSRPALLARALEYPDVRVQLAAADGLLRAPVALSPAVRARVLAVLKNAAAVDAGLAPDAKGMALVVDPNRLRNDTLASLLRYLGYTVEQYVHGREVLRRLGQGADYDLLLVDRHVPDPLLNDFLSQVRSDVKSGGVPIAVVASPDKPLAPTLDGLVLRLALLIAATETESVNVPSPFVPSIRALGDENERSRAANVMQRDSTLRTLARARQERLARVIDSSNLVLSAAQRDLLNLRIEQLTWAVVALQYPISPESAPETAAYLAEFYRRLALQPPVAPAENVIGIDGLYRRIERLQIDVDNQPLIKERYDRLRAAIDVDALGIDVGRTRDDAAEALVERIARKYPGVTVIPSPYSHVGLVEDLEKTFLQGGRPPRDAGEKLESARLAVDWLRKMATGQVPGFDVTSATSELKTALGSDVLAPAAIEALSAIPTGEAQQALMNVVLSNMRPAALRLQAADALIRHAQAHGRLIPQTQRAALDALAAAEKEADLQPKLAVLQGLFNFNAARFLQDLRQFSPPSPAPPASIQPKNNPPQPQ